MYQTYQETVPPHFQTPRVHQEESRKNILYNGVFLTWNFKVFRNKVLSVWYAHCYLNIFPSVSVALNNLDNALSIAGTVTGTSCCLIVYIFFSFLAIFPTKSVTNFVTTPLV